MFFIPASSEIPRRKPENVITFGDPAEAAVRTLSRDGVNLAGWRSKGYTYVLVGWAETGVLSQLAAEIAPQLDRI